MKKLLIAFILVLFFSFSYSQTQKVTLSKNKHAFITTELFYYINDGDTTHVYSMYFQNAEYQHITDLKFIYFYKKDEFEKAKELFKIASEWDTKQDISHTVNDIYISTFMKKTLYLSYDGGHTLITPKKLKLLVQEMENIDISKFL